MKALNLIILALTVTLFVACSKKKDGGSNTQPYNNPYGLTPNDVYSGIPNVGGPYPPNPGYQAPPGGNCNGPSQMFPDLMSYCGWLARDGERMCNPMVVRQAFLQYCQGFAVQFNYCVPQVRTGCFYAAGCSFGGSSKKIRFASHKREKYKDDGSYNSGGTLPPVVVYPPADNICQPDKDRDCKERKKVLWCKKPTASTADKNYKYSYGEYLALINKDCDGSAIAQAPVQSTPVQSVPVKSAPVAQTPVASKATAAAPGCMNLEKIRDYIADQKSGVGSYSDYFKVELLDTGKSKSFVDSWKAALKPRLDKYPVSIAHKGYKSEYTAIAANVDQTADQLRIVADAGKIISCDSNHLTVQFSMVEQTNRLNNATYTWNGLYGTDLEIIETINGTFKAGTESANYSISRYIGTAGKNLNEKQVEAKVSADMKRKGYL